MKHSRRRRIYWTGLCSGLLVCGFAAAAWAQTSQDALTQGFETPPNSARPRVWWHWMNGNITQEGIEHDLQWMSDVGLGGATIFEGSIDTPQVVKQRLIYMTPGWKAAFRDAVSTADRLGLEISIASSPGWSETGGPWVTPAEGMKKMVWSETRVDGGRPFAGTLPQPPRTTGTFQDYEVKSETTVPLPEFYADAAVVAYRLPADDETGNEPTVTASGGQVNAATLSDGKVGTVALALPTNAENAAWVRFAYARPQQVQAVTLATLDDIASIFSFDDPNAVSPRLEASEDDVTYRAIAEIPVSSVPERTISFPAVTAKYFRVVFPAAKSGVPESAGQESKPHLISELVLHSDARVNEFEKRAGFSTAHDYYAIPTPEASAGSVIAPKDVIDLTGKMKSDGSLEWTPPAGQWVILRIGYSLTGHQNGPAPAEATGLEVDKLNRPYVKNYVDGYLKTYEDTVGPESMGKSGIRFLLSDSTEVGAQNWTDDILAQFRARRGYDAHPWLPALTGVILESPQATDRFLWDFRRTIAELTAQNHYGEIADELHRHGIGYYNEALEYHRPSLGDDMEMRQYADIPMGAVWTFPPDGGSTLSYIADVRGAASVSHVYGKKLVGAESMTSGGPAWGYAPNNLKMIADLEFALGVNRFMIHESSHQPLMGKAPGMTLGPYGLWFNRNETWAQKAGPWVTYLARNSFLLQQGRFFADVAYFYGQEAPLTALYGWKAQQDAPDGYGFDFVNSDVVLHQLSYKDGRLVTPGGASYRILYLGGSSSRMTVPVLRRIRDLVAEGAVVVGDKPVSSPSLADNDAEFRKLVDELWGSEDAVRSVGKGRVYAGKSANEILADLHVVRDFDYSHPQPDTTLMFVHRKIAEGDIYFVDNREDRAENVDAMFRVQGRQPELWHADTGKTEPVSYRIANGVTTVPLALDPYGTVFVVFRKPASSPAVTLPQRKETELATVSGAWDVSFPPNWGAPAQIRLQKLASWTENADPGVKYFSGTATYTRVVHAEADWFRPGASLWLDLGEVKELADVTVNGQHAGIVWKRPYRLDVTRLLKPGDNQIRIEVTNLWVNRLIGDQQPNAKQYTFTDFKPYQADSPLRVSGLLGPVQLLSSK